MASGSGTAPFIILRCVVCGVAVISESLTFAITEKGKCYCFSCAVTKKIRDIWLWFK